MTSPSPAPLTEAERAAAEALALWHNAHSSTSRLAVAAFEGEARAVVAAVGPFMAIKFYENLADLTEKQGPMSAAGFRALALLTRQSLSRPTSEEETR